MLINVFIDIWIVRSFLFHTGTFVLGNYRKPTYPWMDWQFYTHHWQNKDAVWKRSPKPRIHEPNVSRFNRNRFNRNRPTFNPCVWQAVWQKLAVHPVSVEGLWSKAYDRSRSAEHWPECSRGRVVHSGSDLSRHLCGGVYCVWGFRSILPKTLAVQIPLSLLPLTPITERLPRPTWIQLVAVWNNLMRIFIFYIPFTWVVCLDLPVIFQADLKGYPMSNLWSCGVDLLKSGALRIYAW